MVSDEARETAGEVAMSSSLMQRLAEMMPKKATAMGTRPAVGYGSGTGVTPFEIHPIRMSADSFTHWLNGDLPKDESEMRAILWVFGEIICGDMEKRLNYTMKLQGELLNSLPPATVVLQRKG